MALAKQANCVRYIRCPLCLASSELPSAYDQPDTKRVCPTCLAKFSVKDAKSAPPPLILPEGQTEKVGSGGILILLFLVAIVTTLGCGYLWETKEQIPQGDFLWYFGILIVSLIAVQWLVREVLINSWFVRLVASGVLVSVGLTWVLKTWKTGKLDVLTVVFFGVVGVILLFAEFKTGWGGGGGCSGCGSGCSGGCGGGCGGCGD